MLKKNKEILIFLSLGIVLIISMFFVFNKKPEYKELPKVKLKEQSNNKKQFAIMLEKTKGEGDYQESNNNDLPLGGYRFNKEKSGCINNNGQKINNALNYDYETYTVILETNSTSYCYLYYDKDNVINYLRSTDTENHLSSEKVGGIYRYQGLYTDQVNNYICLGENCCSTTECKADSNDSMYRIIGVTENGELKVIKKVQLPFGLGGSFNIEDVKWPQSLIYQKLNGKSDDGSTKPNLNDINSYYYSLDSKLKKLIINNHSWLYGDISDNLDYNGNLYYDIETGFSDAKHYIKKENDYIEEPYKWTETIEAPIGVMYIHDYLFSYPNGNPSVGSIAKNSWIHWSKNQLDGVSEYTMSRYGYDKVNGGYYVILIGSGGNMYQNPDKNFEAKFRPVFYLISDIGLTGEGTLTNPFRIF